MPAPVMIASRPLLPRMLLLFWLAVIAVGLLFAGAGYGLLGARQNGGAMMLFLMGLVLAVAGVVVAGHCWRAARIRGNAIEMTEAGLLDRRLAANPIPWAAISWKVMFNGRSYNVQMDVAEPARSAARIAWPSRALGLFSRLLRQPELSVSPLGTGLSAHEIGERMAGFKDPVG